MECSTHRHLPETLTGTPVNCHPIVLTLKGQLNIFTFEDTFENIAIQLLRSTQCFYVKGCIRKHTVEKSQTIERKADQLLRSTLQPLCLL